MDECFSKICRCHHSMVRINYVFHIPSSICMSSVYVAHNLLLGCCCLFIFCVGALNIHYTTHHANSGLLALLELMYSAYKGYIIGLGHSNPIMHLQDLEP